MDLCIAETVTPVAHPGPTQSNAATTTLRANSHTECLRIGALRADPLTNAPLHSYTLALVYLSTT